MILEIIGMLSTENAVRVTMAIDPFVMVTDDQRDVSVRFDL